MCYFINVIKANNFFLFPYLRYKCDKSYLVYSSNYRNFYDCNIHLIADYPELRVYDNFNDPFSLIKMNIILQSLVNKKHIEQEVNLYQDANLKLESINLLIHNRLPYLKIDNEKIYVPIFTELINKVYDNDLNLLLKAPYDSLKKDFSSSLINPFSQYGYKLFDSFFTNLIMIKESPSKDSAAFYAIDLEMIFIITDQGTLEERINLFDNKTIDKSKNQLFERLVKLVDYYYSNDKENFIKYLYEGKFITKQTYEFILKKEMM